MKWNDTDANGVNNGEDPIMGWNITLSGYDTIKNEQVDLWMETNSNGDYWFTGLTNGTYTICEEMQTGWMQTHPSNDGDNDCIEGIEILSGTNSTGNDFGNFELGGIHGMKWNDTNADGLFNNMEDPIMGWNITLSGYDTIKNEQVDLWMETNSNGDYWFTGLTNGTYTICEEMQTGWMQTHPSNDGDNDCIEGIEILSGTNSTGNDFGNFELGGIHGMKWNDTNADGLFNNMEDPIMGWNITLSGYDTIKNEQVDLWMETNSNGDYWFTGLTNGTYTICEEMQTGWMQTHPSNDGDNDCIEGIEILSGTNSTGNDFGNFELGGIHGMKWNDTNADGLFNNMEDPIMGWNITLSGYDTIKNEQVDLWMETNSNGDYWFTGLTNGTYTICEEMQTGWMQTHPSNDGDNDCIEGIEILSGTNSTGNDFGNFELGSIHGLKYRDIDGNGTMDGQDNVLAGWNITLSGYDTIKNEQVDLWMKTDSNGDYWFTGLTNGTYTVCEVLENEWYRHNQVLMVLRAAMMSQ